MQIRALTIILVFCFPILLFSQVEELNPPNYIKTITFKSANTQQGELPILQLNEPFLLEFDALVTTEPDFYYTIEHYNYDWTKSNLVKMEYMIGFDDYRIVDYSNSYNAYQLYSHYRLQIPNQQTRALTKSGNYLISIYNDDRELVFTRKFMIYEQKLGVGVEIKRSRDVRYIAGKQNVDIRINTGGVNVNNPLQTINTLIIQNNNLRTAIKEVKPQYTLGQQLVYRYTDETAFWAGNEFRFFENKDVRAANVGVQFIDLKDIYHNYLFVNFERASQPYTYNPDINGNFLVTALNVEDVNIEADYTMTHFALAYPELTDGSKIYIYGNFNNYALEDMNRMVYNRIKKRYEAAFKLKQGFYNYKYVVLNPDGKLDEGRISGNYWQTENNYKVLVYYRDLGARYDELIGFGEATSVNISN
ncbi:DUF5103 domain-containing protein [Psychroserpens sp. XS_ASV72]|uniref:type IX secretion system plug protein n=1 Tax=Psychroserpens sp. XS_ASV72 TaxID=3241293 RepID=UPI00351249E1